MNLISKGCNPINDVIKVFTTCSPQFRISIYLNQSGKMELTFFDLNLRTPSNWSKFVIQNWVDHVVNSSSYIKTLHYLITDVVLLQYLDLAHTYWLS